MILKRNPGVKRKAAFIICLAAFAASVGLALFSPGFSDWGNKRVAGYYIENGLSETMCPNIVNSVVWDFRAFDTLGEETVLFTAAVGVFSIMVFGKREKGREKERIGR